MTELSGDNENQYGTSKKLEARARLQGRYTIAEIGWFQWVAQHMGLHGGETVLDIGCGPGWFWANTADQLPEGLSLTLADKSPGMVREALERCAALGFDHIEGMEADAAALPFADARFDIVVAMHMLYHVPDPAAAIAECFRVMRPGGRMVVTTNGAGNMPELYALTTAFGGTPIEPVADVFGIDIAERLLRERFGNVELAVHPARMRITDKEDVFLALTSHPPGETAKAAELADFRARIEEAFARGGGVLEAKKEMAVLVAEKG
ncbi:hypothetical protein GCM10007989_09960 [Devosia pacifica]|uniref:Methyltransferase type 11 domain-containing protein n=1 Tax=Devosia pacifica TaxID=1335967 RepID=A0A918S0Z0_9HYPH|nr:class I SAM-dependent methyltransferase [Devosia pacifica]GHA16811.1 hypothetical protein GCM10007989_09960 [Devosia pacifica]